MIVCDDCKEKGMTMINPKNMDGHRTDFPATCNFVVGVSAPDLKVNPQRLAAGNYKITAAKWGNSSSSPLIMRDDVRLIWSLHKQLPPPCYTQSLLLLQNASSTKSPGMLLQECAFD
jgi:hypothetical protein